VVRDDAEEGGRPRLNRIVTAHLETQGQREAALFRFDSRGYWIHRELLDRHQLEDARERLAQLALTRDAWHESQQRALSIHLVPGLLKGLGETLHGHPATALTIGYPHRLLESYALTRPRGLLNLHGGGAEYVAGSDARDISARSWAAAGRSYALRVKVLVYLDDVVLPQDGRLAYIEGSHKAEFAFHRAFPGGRDEAADLMRTIEMRAGDAIWLNEALLHGAERKETPSPRRLLAYTFGPTFMANWSELEQQSIASEGYASAETETPNAPGLDE
jgi:hypothetical protein